MKKLFALALIISLIGFGCKGLSTEERAAVSPVTLNYWTVFNDVEQLRQLASEYKQLRPYVTINVRQVRYEEFDKLFVNALADDVGPDIASLHVRWLRRHQSRLAEMPGSVRIARLVIKGKYQPQTEVTIENPIMPTQNEIRRNYVQSVADDAIIDGQVYGLPIAMDTLALYYNKELLDRAGVPVPPATWDDFVATVKKATRYDRDGNIIQSGVALGTGANIENAADILALLIMQNGVEVTEGNRVTFADNLGQAGESHPTFEAMRFYTDFARPTKDVYSWNGKLGSALENFARGVSVFYFGFAYDQARIRARGPQLKPEAVAVPQLNVSSPVNVANYWVESVMKKSKNQNEAWDFIRYLSAPDNIKKYTEKTGQPSPLRAQVIEQQTDPARAPFAAQVLVAKNWYRGKDYEAARQALTDLLADYIQPYGEEADKERRDSDLLNRAAAVIQQTY